MPVTKDTRRNKYVARLSYKGVRHYVGQYDDEKTAKNALKVREQMLRRLDGYSLEGYKIELEEPMHGKSWRRSIGAWLQRRKEARSNSN